MRGRGPDRKRTAGVWPPVLLAALCGCGDVDASLEIGGYRYPLEGLTQWALPKQLREVSGLALDRDGRLFAHADEAAVIVELDFRNGRMLKRFALGDPPRPGDYEGIAWVERTVFLVTSDGELLEAEEGGDGSWVNFQLHRTGLGERCEIEGLDYDARRESLMLLCKTPRSDELRGRIALLAWSLRSREAMPEHDVTSPWSPGAGLPKSVHPSALVRSPGNGHFVVAAAREGLLLELDDAGALIRAIAMPERRGHRQMEGIAMTPDGDLIIADEGGGKRGRLSVYAAAR